MTALLKKYWLLKACARRRERTHDLAPRLRLAMGRAWMLSGLGLISVHAAWVRLVARCQRRALSHLLSESTAAQGWSIHRKVDITAIFREQGERRVPPRMSEMGSQKR